MLKSRGYYNNLQIKVDLSLCVSYCLFPMHVSFFLVFSWRLFLNILTTGHTQQFVLDVICSLIHVKHIFVLSMWFILVDVYYSILKPTVFFKRLSLSLFTHIYSRLYIYTYYIYIIANLLNGSIFLKSMICGCYNIEGKCQYN